MNSPVVTQSPQQTCDVDLDDPRWYLNRELTWLEFNRRVLNEGADPRTPLLERVNFLAIVGSNLDEFFMKRIGGLKQQIGAGVNAVTVDGRTPEQQIEEAILVVQELLADQTLLLRELMQELAENGVVLRSYDSLEPHHRKWLRQHYSKNIFPLVTPLAIDPAHPFPFVSNLSVNVLALVRGIDDGESLIRIKYPVSGNIPRFIRIGAEQMFVPLEQVITANLDLLLPGIEIRNTYLFRVTRNAITERDEEQANDLLELIRAELRERKFAPVVRLEVGRDMPQQLRDYLAKNLGLTDRSDIAEVDELMGRRDLAEIARLPIASLRYPAHTPADHRRLRDARSVFEEVRRGPLLLQHPYQSFTGSITRLLKEAVDDPDVLAIKMTLYRTSADSQVIPLLVEAATRGKQVAVVLELKARFDEAANIQWADHLEEAGIHLSYGVVGYKTHAKMILILRKERDGLRRYVHVGTGNYHSGTASQYGDVCLLSCDDDLGVDATELFNSLTTGSLRDRSYRKLLTAPLAMKSALIAKIEREAELHGQGTHGLIQLKTNALEDKDIVKALYKASQAGVRIDLIVRDTCRLRPGIAGLSENITVISIVGRFLEHSRIYYFRNGGNDEYYIGSADCMTRNLTGRVEALAPIEDPALKTELRTVLDLQLSDRRSAWDMKPDGSYVQRVPDEEGDLSSQTALIDRATFGDTDDKLVKRRSI
ncbi:MAG TPA: polyphosphate kinase 1 [Woeseiaceae bacterium]